MYSSIYVLYTSEYYDEEVAGRACDLATLNTQFISVVKWITYLVLCQGWDFSQLYTKNCNIQFDFYTSLVFFTVKLAFIWVLFNIFCFNTIGRLHPWFLTFSYFYIINIVYIFLWCSRYCHKKRRSEIDNLL